MTHLLLSHNSITHTIHVQMHPIPSAHSEESSIHPFPWNQTHIYYKRDTHVKSIKERSNSTTNSSNPIKAKQNKTPAQPWQMNYHDTMTVSDGNTMVFWFKSCCYYSCTMFFYIYTMLHDTIMPLCLKTWYYHSIFLNKHSINIWHYHGKYSKNHGTHNKNMVLTWYCEQKQGITRVKYKYMVLSSW